jgi:Holliday junction resolvasome RuvABC endonuclease subunit
MNDSVNILGLDASTVAIGWALVNFSRNNERLLNSGVFILDGDTMHRIKRGHDSVFTLLCQLNVVDLVAFEIPASRLKFETTYKLGWIEGACIVAALAYRSSIELMGIAPDEAKLATAGYVRAKKDAVQVAVNRRLGCDIENCDESDAAAIALAAMGRLRMIELEVATTMPCKAPRMA